MEAKFVDVTPKIAEQWLTKNLKNRKITELTVESYARDMKKGFWAETGDTIKFDEEGILIDGQQRLNAIIYSGSTQKLLVVRGIKKTFFDGHLVQETIDRGRPRSPGDNLKIAYGYDYATAKASIALWIAYLCIQKQVKLTTSQTYEILNIYKEEVNAVITNQGHTRGLNLAPVMSALVFAAQCYKNETIEFEKKYFSGESLKKGNPSFTLRNWMLEIRTKGRNNRITIQKNTLTALYYHISNKELKKLIPSHQGYDFFLSKQRKTVNQIEDLLRY